MLVHCKPLNKIIDNLFIGLMGSNFLTGFNDKKKKTFSKHKINQNSIFYLNITNSLIRLLFTSWQTKHQLKTSYFT
jgi:hypothetical protein